MSIGRRLGTIDMRSGEKGVHGAFNAQHGMGQCIDYIEIS